MRPIKAALARARASGKDGKDGIDGGHGGRIGVRKVVVVRCNVEERGPGL